MAETGYGTRRRGAEPSAAAKAAYRAQGKAKADAAIAQLDAGLTAMLEDDERFAEYLRLSGRMHKYSPRNRLLILLEATRRGVPAPRMVAGFHRWRELGRPVRKGAKGYAILAPMTGKREDEETGEAVVFVRGFRVEHVFAAGDTDGPPIELPHPIPATDDGPEARALADRLAACGAPLGIQCEYVHGSEWGNAVDGRPAGRAYLLERRVVCNGALSGAERATTWAHELAHIVADHRAAKDDRVSAETIAECASYVVLSALGLDTAGFTLPYVASFIVGAGDDALGRFKRVVDRIGLVAGEILAVAETAGGSCFVCGWDGVADGGGCEHCR